MRAVDLSAWSGLVAPDRWPALKAAGIDLVIVQLHGGGPGGTGLNPHANAALGGARDAGMYVAAYVWPPDAWPAALNHIPHHLQALRFLALDVEASAIVRHDMLVGPQSFGLRPVIYTSRSSWSQIMLGGRDFADIPLWDAGYWESLGPDSWPFDLADRWAPYGGWTQRVGWQFKGTTLYEGVSVDLNLFDDAFVIPQEAPPQELSLEERVKALEEALKVLYHSQGFQDAILVDHGNFLRRLRAAFEDFSP